MEGLRCPSCESSRIKWIHIHDIYLCFNCDDNFTKEAAMQPWYLDKKYWMQTLSGECCSTTELMGKFDEDQNSWEYALVMYHDGKVSLKCMWSGSQILYPVGK